MDTVGVRSHAVVSFWDRDCAKDGWMDEGGDNIYEVLGLQAAIMLMLFCFVTPC